MKRECLLGPRRLLFCGSGIGGGPPGICGIEVATGTTYAVDDLTCLPAGRRGCTEAESKVYSAAISADPCP